MADAAAMTNHLSQNMGMAQELCGAFHLTQFHKAADIGGTDGGFADLNLGNDITAQTQLLALFHQKFRTAGVFVAEMVIVARDQMNRMIALHQNLRDEIIPGGGAHLIVKRNHDDILNSVQTAQQIPAVFGGVDEGAGNSRDDLFRHPIKCKNSRRDTAGGGFFNCTLQQGSMTQMDSVKEAQGNNFFLHGHSVTLQRSS